jgi:hypothetical protein
MSENPARANAFLSRLWDGCGEEAKEQTVTVAFNASCKV